MMSPFRQGTLCVLLTALLQCAGSCFGFELKRDTSAPINKFLDCATEILGRPVLVYDTLQAPLREISCKNLDAETFARKVEDAGFRVLLSRDWALVVDSGTAKREGWRDLQVDVRVSEKDSKGPPLPKSVLKQLQRDILKKARFFPTEAMGSSLSTGTARFLLLFDVYRRAIAGKNSVIVLVHMGEEQTNTDTTDPSGRVIFGELQGSRVTLLWQSPIVQTDGQLEFEDIDGDGNPEILLWSLWIQNMTDRFQTLTIFDKSGRELTREEQNSSHEADCEFEGGATILGGTTCPIVGTEIRIIKGVTPNLITYWGGPNDDRSVMLKLVNGRYARITSMQHGVAQAEHYR